MRNQETIREHVANGARWLDKTQGEWAGEVDLETLNMYDTYECVYGQMVGTWLEEADTRDGYDFLWGHGFTIVPPRVYWGDPSQTWEEDQAERDTYAQESPEWAQLHSMWLEEITSRLS